MADDANRNAWGDLEDGFVMVPLNLFKMGLSSQARLVYETLRAHANEHKECWPSYETLKRETGLSRNKISAAIHELEARVPPLIGHTVDRTERSTNVYRVYDVILTRDDAVTTRDEDRPDPKRRSSRPGTRTISKN